MPKAILNLAFLCCLALVALPGAAHAADIARFLGIYEGSAEFVEQGEARRRDLRTEITEIDDGFNISWTSVSYKADGRTKEKTYAIDFLPSKREKVFRSAMQKSVFGKLKPLDPMAGEPYVWARLDGDTLSLYSLFINDLGEYEMQEYHRTLADGGLELLFKRVHKGVAEKEIRTFLSRVE